MHLRPWLLLAVFLPFFAIPAAADTLPDRNAFREGHRVLEGFMPLVIDEDQGRIYLEVPADVSEFILQASLARGLGSNDIGLDRGQLGSTRLASFSRVGRKALLVASNTGYRAETDNAAERLAVAEAFASSTLWGFTVVASDEGGYTIDYTDYILSDSYRIGERLKRQEQGTFKVDAQRSAPYLPLTKAFPDNTEIEGILTLAGTGAGDYLRSVAPDSSAVTVHVHHSFIRLPPPGYAKRAFHPESGYFAMTYADYSSPVEDDLVQRYIYRHRLEKQDPDAAMSRPVEPIVYYLDPGVPEPVRSALLDGARWWNEAFEAAGFIDAFQVRMLPGDADPMDVRYNVIQWVHRSTRGWSYGSSIRDPRTGEILKGKVTLGSLRIRQDILIAQGLLSPYTEGTPVEEAAARLKEMAIARIRQLSAHEIGHTLGLAHNFSASTDDRGSVMDYPHPLLKITNGEIDLSDAYDTGIGEWDKHAITYGYAVTDDEAAFLKAHLARGRQEGLAIISDADARPMGGAHPTAHLWDSGADVIAELDTTMDVRAIAIDQMGTSTIPPGTPYASLAEILVPIFYLHRYQSEAVVKLIGGVAYDYAIKGDGDYRGVSPVAAETQRAALEGLLDTLALDALVLPGDLLELIAPKPLGYRRTRESPPSRTLPVFDPVSVAEASVESVVSMLMNANRLARVRQQAETTGFGVADLIDQLTGTTIFERRDEGLAGDVQFRRDLVVVEHLLTAAFGGQQVPEVEAEIRSLLPGIERRLRSDYLKQLIKDALEDGAFERSREVASMPPGSPI